MDFQLNFLLKGKKCYARETAERYCGKVNYTGAEFCNTWQRMEHWFCHIESFSFQNCKDDFQSVLQLLTEVNSKPLKTTAIIIDAKRSRLYASFFLVSLTMSQSNRAHMMLNLQLVALWPQQNSPQKLHQKLLVWIGLTQWPEFGHKSHRIRHDIADIRTADTNSE